MCRQFTLEIEPEIQRNGCRSVDAIDPHTGEFWKVLLTDEKLRFVQGQGIGRTTDLAYIVTEVLKSPVVGIFQGLREDQNQHNLPIDESDGMLCYCGIPRNYFDYKLEEMKPNSNRDYFMVFVNEERIIFHWYWVSSESGDMTSPVVYNERFREKIL